jgi:hypothetical protein
MSTLMLNPDTKSELKKKKKKSSKKAKSELTYEEAIKQIQAYNVEIAEAAKYRIYKPSLHEGKIFGRYFAKSGLFLGTVSTAEIVVAVNNGWSSMDGTGVVMSTILFGSVASLLLALKPKIPHAVSPIKTRKAQEQHRLDMALYDMKEAEFTEGKNKILEKATPAIKLINETLKFENREVRFNPNRGKEKLLIEEIENLDSWQQELLKVEKQKLGFDSRQEILPAEPRKEITV